MSSTIVWKEWTLDTSIISKNQLVIEIKWFFKNILNEEGKVFRNKVWLIALVYTINKKLIVMNTCANG